MFLQFIVILSVLLFLRKYKRRVLKSKSVSASKVWTTPGGQYYKLYKIALDNPHLLIAGATGSGKSVFIRGLMSVIMNRLPVDKENGAFCIFIDAKRVELVEYKELPHCILYASEPREMVEALQYALNITETRYTEMQSQGVKKYNGADIYVIIDEFADLMTTNRRQVQPLVQRLAQIGRAAKVHIILATQTPIAKVIPTEIKCNFDARIGLRTRSAQDSRNIIGMSGLEEYPRYGQCYYMSPETEGCYTVDMVEDAEIQRLISHWAAQSYRLTMKNHNVISYFKKSRRTHE